MPAYIGDPAEKRARYATLASSLTAQRTAGFDQHWRELADFLMPRRVRINNPSDRNRGDKRNQNIIDSSGRFALRTLSSGLHAGLTSPARPWMKLTTPDPKLAAYGPVKEWLATVTQYLLTMFATTNLYNVLPLVYTDMGGFGTAAMSMVPDTHDIFRSYSYPVGSYALGMNERGLVCAFVRDYELSVRQIVEQFGVQPNGRDIDWSGISDTVKGLWIKGDYEQPIPVTWIVQPNAYQDSSRLASKYLPFASCYFETGAPTGFLRESGFNTFPIMAPRWDITGEDTYGTSCPGMDALGDVKQLQVMQRRKAQLLNKAVDPPMQGPSTLRTQKTSILPGDITYVDVRDGMKGLHPVHEVRLEGFQHLTADVREVQYRIQRAFFEDLFLMIQSSDDRLGAARPTAREIDERHEEKLLALGPVLERTGDELLDPIVDRAFDMMNRAGMIPPAPDELQGSKLKVEYISILAQAQKLAGVVTQDRFLQSTSVLLQVYPEVRFKVDPFEVVDNYADQLGVDPKIIRSNKDAQAMADAEKQAVNEQANVQKAALLAKGAKDAAAAPLSGDTALSRIANTAQQPTAPSVP